MLFCCLLFVRIIPFYTAQRSLLRYGQNYLYLVALKCIIFLYIFIYNIQLYIYTIYFLPIILKTTMQCHFPFENERNNAVWVVFQSPKYSLTQTQNKRLSQEPKVHDRSIATNKIYK